jgi:hypothetical protein
MTRKILLALADTHAGHKSGLMNPEVELEDETEDGGIVTWTPTPTAWQIYLWNLYRWGIECVKRIAGDDEIIVIHLGDLTQGDKFGNHLVSPLVSDQVTIACANLAYLVNELPGIKHVEILYGTAVHVWGEGATEKLAAKWLQAKYGDRLEVSTMYHGLLDMDGMTIDASHHGPGVGSREWLKGNIARFYLRDLMLAELKLGNTPPKLVLRAHVHDYLVEVLIELWGECEVTSRIILLPSFCGVSDFVRKMSKSEFIIRNGMIAFEIVDGSIHKVYPLIKTKDLRTRERI